MGFKLRLKTENMGLLLASIFYAVAGIACFVILATMDYELVHIGLIGIISLATTYGLIRRRRWALWSIFVLFFTNTTFAISMLYYTLGGNIITDTAMILYLILTWVATIYLTARRKKLES
ncbi:MAG: hypothetical protein QXO50_04130 [Candidatus Bathyarchaeia archaeon]